MYTIVYYYIGLHNRKSDMLSPYHLPLTNYQPNMSPDQLYTVEQTALILKVHPLTIRRYIKTGRLKAVKVGGNIRVPQSEIDNFSKAIIPNLVSSRRVRSDVVAKFALDDPIFSLRGKGLSIKGFDA